ncbi:hypothetical protein CERZMDRAFT_62385 [Cercospora zeae-maydis SCOH1-5]|uniref:DNA replication regulator Sld3 C-terminal domain-containing protein n=1 Tax=Cercospora zeae-maydis SCOH1-5 TaxID=717836 RepID=A0A6A6F5Q0_9PEZI|nr:hypothetical protein CERZMDRAFT_62385 [Cercospora zeae-maydis SCOH1-5]
MSGSRDAASTATAAAPITTSQKRSRDEREDCRSAIDRRPVILRACTADPPAPPLVLTPQCLLSRTQLPRAYLDPAQDHRRLFTAHVHLLETGHEIHDSTSILLAEDNADHSLYTIERVQSRTYALCRLARSQALEQPLALPSLETITGAPSKKRCIPRLRDKSQPWWAMAAVEAQPYSTHPRGQVPTLAMQPRVAPIPRREEVPRAEHEYPACTEASIPEVLPKQNVNVEQTLEDLSKHYLDALYLSRTTLAYFVKGPLARARAALSSQPAALITFLRGAMLNSTSMDKKFRDVLAGIVKDMSVIDTPETQSKSRRKRKWRPKRDKHGLFVDEKEYIECWWRKHDEAMHALATNETLLRRRLQVVRNRETLLQVVVAMEVLALENAAAACSENPLTVGLRSEELSGDHGEINMKDKKQRKKKEIDVDASLETLVERLNIFHTVEASPVKTQDGENCSAHADTKDELKTFAAEVIIPFFASRIFDIANSVSTKLGGPSAPRPREKSSAKAPRKPGEPTIRQPPEKRPRRPLGRTSTDTLNHVGRKPPALVRSTTDQDALAPLIKREMSETPSLHEIAAAKTATAVSRKRTTGLDHYTAKHRQIDLSAMSQANQAKIRKSKDVEDKILRDALNGIRKPNRALATEETARSADESFARALARSKPPKSQAQRTSLAKDNTKITATPRLVKSTPAGQGQSRNVLEACSGSTAVPSSAIAQPADAHASSGTFAVPHTGHRERHKDIAETPSRGFARFMPPGLAREPGTLIESPTLRRSASILATPMRPLRMPSLAETPLADRNSMQSTGLKHPGDTSHAMDQHEDSGIGLESPGMRDTTSIYDALGWNEDYDELA